MLGRIIGVQTLMPIQGWAHKPGIKVGTERSTRIQSWSKLPTRPMRTHTKSPSGLSPKTWSRRALHVDMDTQNRMMAS